MIPQNNNYSAYLPHVDGLRTIAVCSVFLYHLYPEFISGGFLGVDIFFVISGYLITNIIKLSVERNQFSFSNFYIRRIRRLFPAFALVLLLCLIASYYFLNPVGKYEFAISGLFSVASLANLYYLFHSGYFAPAADNQVLLHTWSLSVEEQFYLIWPLLVLFLVTKIAGKFQLKLVVGSIVAGMLFCYWGTNINKDLAFYITPFRAAEFAVGASLCWLKNKVTSTIIDEIITAIGLLLIVFSLSFISADYNFPGWIVFIPCIGAAVVIYFSATTRISQYIIGNATVAYIGRISYPLYLVHWPLIVFAKLYYENELLLADKLLIIIFAFILAILIYELLEKPLLTTSSFGTDNSKTLKIFLLGIIILTVSFTQLIFFKGLPGQVPYEIHGVIENTSEEKRKRFRLLEASCLNETNWKQCEKNNAKDKTLIILGDSHGPDALNALFPYFDEVNFILKTVPGCPPLTVEDFSRLIKPSHPNFIKCKNMVSELADEKIFEGVDFIIFSIYFNKWYKPQMLDNFLASVEIPKKVKLIILGNAPSFKKPLPQIIADHGSMEGLNATVSQFINEWTWGYESQLSMLANKYNSKFISKAKHFCNFDAKQCSFFIQEGDKLLTYDEHHLSVGAASDFGLSLKNKYPTVQELFDY